MATQRPRTPPAAMAASAVQQSSPITPEQVRRMEEQRLRAKAQNRQQSERQRREGDSGGFNRPSASAFSTGQKRPHDYVQTSSNSGPVHRDARQSSVPSVQRQLSEGTARRPHDDIQPARKFTKYVEYDFSKMTDTKGGFLTAEDDPGNRALHAPNQDEKPAHMTLAEWERHQILKKLRDQRAGPFEPGLSTLRKEGQVCRECGSREIDWQWEQVYGCLVCNTCKDKFPDKYSMLTKTEAKEDYLITDPELNDKDLLPRLEKPNPHKATWNNMQLFLRYQLEEYAFSDRKWGSPEKLDEEFERRQKDRKAKKEAKFKSKLLELKRRTRVDAYKRGRQQGGGGQFGDQISDRRGDRHEHEWGRPVENAEGETIRRCIECGLEIEEVAL